MYGFINAIASDVLLKQPGRMITIVLEFYIAKRLNVTYLYSRILLKVMFMIFMTGLIVVHCGTVRQ